MVSLSPAAWVVARSLLRRRRWASVGFACLAGLAAALPMTVWAAGRLTTTTVVRSLETARAADLLVTVCPTGFDPASSDPVACVEHQPDQELLASIRSVRGVTEVTRASYTLLQVGPSANPTTWRSRALISIADPVAFPTVLGHPQVVAGRLAAGDAPDEVMVNEALAQGFDLEPGDPIWMHAGQPGSADGGQDGAPAPPAAPVQSTVVGIVRTAADLLPTGTNSIGVPPIHVREGWVRAHAQELPPDQTPFFVWLEDGDADQFTTRLQARLGGQSVAVAPALDQGERANLDQATAFESRTALTVAIVAALTVAFFVGQAVSRQGRGESSDAPSLLALGMTRQQLIAAAVARWLPTAVGGAAVAMAATVGASALGPIGLARRAPWEPGVRVDWPVLVAGGCATVILVLLGGTLTSYTLRDQRRASRGSAPRSAGFGSPGVRTGVVLASRSFRRGAALPVISALLGTAFAVSAIITASGGAASLRRVVDAPERFGAPWDALLGGAPDRQQQNEMLAAVPGIEGAAAIPGNTVAIGDQELWIQAMVPIDGVEPLRPVITRGREPVADTEIALGSITMRRLGLDVGDEVPLRSQVLGTEPRPYRVVGVTMVSDGYEPNVGVGGLVTLSGLQRAAPETSIDGGVDIVVRVAAGAQRAAALASLQEAFPYAQVPFPLPTSLANAKRIAGLPLVLGVAAAAVAAVTLAHALIMSVRRNRRELAVCRVLGFTRGQVYGAVATQATLLGLTGALVGVLLGVFGARWGWQVLADSFGVASGAVVPVSLALLAVLAVLGIANLAAAAPGRRAAHLRAAEVLRAE